MRLLTRMSTLVTANLNDLIDQCEDPEKMLRQAVREMEASLGHLIDGAAGAIAQHKLLLHNLPTSSRQSLVARHLRRQRSRERTTKRRGASCCVRRNINKWQMPLRSRLPVPTNLASGCAGK